MPFLWFWINSEIKVSLLHVTSMMWSSSSVSSNMPVLRFIFNKQNRSHFLLCQATLCLCAFAYDVPLVWNIFSPLIDFCHRISNHNFHWKMPPQSTKLSSCASFLGSLPNPRRPLSFYNAQFFLCYHIDYLSFITLVPGREVQQKAVELSLYYLLSLRQVTWPSHISVSVPIQGLCNYLIECGKISIRLCKIKLLGKRQVS